jgi:hypothetical protein
MTENPAPDRADWLDAALSCSEAEPVPAGFKIRLMRRIEAHGSTSGRRSAPMWVLAAASLALLATGYWLGMGAPALRSPTRLDGPETAALELQDIWAHRGLLESWELLQDPELEFGFSESEAGAWAFDSQPVPSQENPR